MTAEAGESAARCAVHPGRPAVDICPICRRGRCGADATDYVTDCAACHDRDKDSVVPPLNLRALAGAGVACGLACLPGAAVASEYVGARWFGVIVPGLLGIVMGIIAEWAARGRRGLPLRLAVAAYALIGTGYSFKFVPGDQSAFTPIGDVVGPYVAAVVGAWLWTAPPRQRSMPHERRTTPRA